MAAHCIREGESARHWAHFRVAHTTITPYLGLQPEVAIGCIHIGFVKLRFAKSVSGCLGDQLTFGADRLGNQHGSVALRY